MVEHNAIKIEIWWLISTSKVWYFDHTKMIVVGSIFESKMTYFGKIKTNKAQMEKNSSMAR